ncbi:MAG TPA: purine-nucleoside phosphorylase [Acidobacteriaceae bacterium]|nr:purine-nucleoside phosphorylase [Acidobacteriaceae bacterium]
MQNPELYDQITEAAQFIESRTTLRPSIGVVLGSGFGGFASRINESVVVPYSDIPHFPRPTAPGHSGRLLIGTLKGTPIAVMQGRVHGYEGYGAGQVSFPTRVLARLGIRTLILTNASGGIRTGFHEGQLVLISDHINLTGQNPAIGPNDERLGVRFFDMGDAYSRRLRALARSVAEAEGLTLEEGVYVSLPGPSYETPAEIRAFRTLGADMVGMSTVLETIAARHMGVEVLGISCVTNMAAGVKDQVLTAEEVLETGKRVEAEFARLLTRIVAAIAESGAPAA